MPAAKPIKALIWDLGGVLVRTQDPRGRRRWEKRLGLQPGDLQRLVFTGQAGRRAAVGKASVDQVWQWVCRHFELTPQECQAMAKDFWRGDEVDHRLVNYLRSLRPAYKIGLLSNAWGDLRHLIEYVWRIADAFDHMVISAEVGIAKPDERIFHLALERLGVAAGETIFIDDFSENLEAARRLGMATIHFKDPETALAELEARLGRQT